MTREEIDRHVAGIMAIRRFKVRARGQRKQHDRGYDTTNDFNPTKRRVLAANVRTYDSDVSPVDQVFTARQRFGWLPRGGDE